MCGIVGIFPLNKPDKKISDNLQRGLALWFHNELLFHTQKRGRDATGVSISLGAPYDDPEAQPFWAVLKQPVDAEDFLMNDGTDKRYVGQGKKANIEYVMEAMKNVNRPLVHIIGHARAKTTGSETNAHNNHPIIVGNIIGVHNGGVKNVKKILEKHPEMTQIGEVDSEAIFQLFSEVSNDKALDEESVEFVCKRIEGPRAVLAFNRNHPHKVAFFRDNERPMEISLIRELGLLIICSDKDFLKATMMSYQRMRLLYSKVLPGEEQLPKAFLEHSYLLQDEGGVIDTTKEITNAMSLSKYLSVKKFPSTMADYKAWTQTTGTGSSSHYPHQGEFGHGSGHVRGPGSVSGYVNQPKLVETEASGAADYEDHSTYEEKEEETSAIVVRDRSSVMDDATDESGTTVEATIEIVDSPESSEELNQEEDPEEYEEFSDEELRGMAFGIYSDPAYQDAKYSVFNRLKGQIKDLMNIQGFDEEKSEAALEYIYPEPFSDGFLVGFRMRDEHYEEQEETVIEKMEATNDRLQDQLSQTKDQLRKASGHMANLKSFILATLLAKDLVSVDDEDQIHFEEEIEHFFGMSSNGFSKVRLAPVRNMFGKKEKEAIKFGMVNQAKKLKTKKSKKSI